MATPTRSSCATASHPHNQVHAVERGQADWPADGIPATLLREVTTRFPAQLHRLQAAETDFLRLNTTQAPFNDLRVRQPLNLAIDRAALVRMWGPAVATPTCQVLPSTQLPRLPALLPVHAGAASGRRLDGTHLVRARRLVAASGTQGEQITVWGASDGPIHETTVVPYIVGVLWQLGYHARARLVPSKYLDDHPQLGKTIQLIPDGLADGTTGDFFSSACSPFGRSNHRWFCDQQLERTIQAGNTLEARIHGAAGVLWARLDREFVDHAAWVP